jgi:hypothetical protein
MAIKKSTPESSDVATGSTLPLWTRYRVRWTFLTRLCSSVPADPDLIAAWIRARQPETKPPAGKSIEEINEEVVASLERGEGEADQTYSMLVFQRFQGGLVMRAGTIKAHIKDCARVLSGQFMGRLQGERSFAVRVVNGLYLDERVYWVPVLHADGTPFTDADGAFDKPVHVKGPRGVQNALKRFEYVEPGAVMEFTIKVLGRSVAGTDLNHLFEFGGTHGYAGERGDGEGRYEYSFEKLHAEG